MIDILHISSKIALRWMSQELTHEPMMVSLLMHICIIRPALSYESVKLALPGGASL